MYFGRKHVTVYNRYSFFFDINNVGERIKRKHDEIQAEIENIDSELAKLGLNRKFDFDLLEEVLALTRNIPKTYKEAPQFLKRKYLNFFYDRIEVNDKKVVNTAYSPLVQELINQQQVILRKNWLPLKDLFCNHKLEFDFTLDDLKIFTSQFNQQAQYQFLRA